MITCSECNAMLAREDHRTACTRGVMINGSGKVSKDLAGELLFNSVEDRGVTKIFTMIENVLMTDAPADVPMDEELEMLIRSSVLAGAITMMQVLDEQSMLSGEGIVKFAEMLNFMDL